MISAGIRFTKFQAPGMAKSFAQVDGGLTKIPAANFSVGTFETISVKTVDELKAFIENLRPGDFLTAGIHQTLTSGNCGPGGSDIHRTKETFPFSSEQPGLLIIDSDNINKLGLADVSSYASALEKLVVDAGYVLSPSASSGITYNGVVGPTNGVHTFLFVEDAASIPTTLETLHKRSVILGYAWPLVTADGKILIRSLVDTAMKTSNQPCFEGGAILGAGITQKREVVGTPAGDDVSFCKVAPVTPDEADAYSIAVKKLSATVATQAEQVRVAWRSERLSKMVAKGCSHENATQTLDAALSGNHPVLSGDFEIQTDHHGSLTVCELLADKVKYHEATCRDPLDPDDGPCKAKIYSNNSGSPALHSFAHGGATYMLEDEPSRVQSMRIGDGLHEAAPNYQRVMSLSEILEEFAYIEHGKGVVPRKTPSALLAFDEFKMATAGSVVQVGKITVPVATEWVKSPQRLTSHTRTFRPGAGEFTVDPEGNKAINLWVPRPPLPTPDYFEDCAQPFFDHVSYLIPDEFMRELFLDYLGHIEQRPGEKAGFGWLMVTDEAQGIGRNWMTGVLARIWPGYTALDFNLIGAIKDSFTGRLSRKLLVVVNEIVATQVKDRHEFVERTKNLVTDETIEINPKFGRRHTEYLLARWIIFSNHIAAMPLSDHDRRFAVVQNPSTPMPPA